MIEKPAGSKFSTIAEEETGKTMPKRSILFALGALLLAAVTAMWATQARRNPAACPYGQRLFLDLPRPFMRRQTLRNMLDLAPAIGCSKSDPVLGTTASMRRVRSRQMVGSMFS